MRFASVSVAYSGSVVLMVERMRNAGTCPVCGKPRREIVDDFIVDGEPYGEPEVMRAWCTPGCAGLRAQD